MKKLILILAAVMMTLFCIAPAFSAAEAEATADEGVLLMAPADPAADAGSADADDASPAVATLDDGFDVGLATVVITVMCALVGGAILIICFILAGRNRNN